MDPKKLKTLADLKAAVLNAEQAIGTSSAPVVEFIAATHAAWLVMLEKFAGIIPPPVAK